MTTDLDCLELGGHCGVQWERGMGHVLLAVLLMITTWLRNTHLISFILLNLESCVGGEGGVW